MNNIINEIESDQNLLAAISSPSDTFEVTLDILQANSKQKLLGELVYFITTENDTSIISIGQITEIKTINKWHEEPSFKAVIKKFGKLPHLSDEADNRLAKLNIQSSFQISKSNSDVNAYKLANSPPTGEPIKKITNNLMDRLLKSTLENEPHDCLGKAFETDVRIPFWFKHFGKGIGGAKDAYHIGVFGKTGSGKTTAAAQILKGYTKNSNYMSMLILDPQEQFYNDNEVLPHNVSFKSEVENNGFNYHAIKIPKDVYLPDDASLFSELLKTSKFMNLVFQIPIDRIELATESICRYIESRLYKDPTFSLSKSDAKNLIKNILNKFIKDNSNGQPSSYMRNIYSAEGAIKKLRIGLSEKLEYLENNKLIGFEEFEQVLSLFKKEHNHQISLDDMVKKVIHETGNLYIVNLSRRATTKIGSDNVQAMIIKLICKKVVEQGEELWNDGKKSNCLICMDEAHRYTSSSPSNPRLKELNKEIIDSVRTTRKYGIGYMFITQTIESIDEEILQQMRIFAFGYGLTMGREFNKIKQIINDESAAKFYKSFIDPSSNDKYPFMFHGPISPLSFTGSPLFIDMKIDKI